MVEKQFTTNEGETYLIGFKEIGSSKDGLECHILKKGLLGNRSVYNKLYLKGMSPDYKHIAQWTLYEYKKECEQKEVLLAEEWS